MDIDITKMEEIAVGVYKKNEKTFYIKCTVNKTLHYCNKARLDKLIKKLGSIEKIGATYISRDAKRDQKASEPTVKSDQKAPKVEKDGSGFYEPGYSLQSEIFAHRKVEVKDIDRKIYKQLSEEGTKCIRRDCLLETDGYCNGCQWFKLCKIKAKKWKLRSNDPERRDIARTIPTTRGIYKYRDED